MEVPSLYDLLVCGMLNLSSPTHSYIEIMFILKAINNHCKGSYDKQNLTLVVISYEMTTHVRSSIY